MAAGSRCALYAASKQACHQAKDLAAAKAIAALQKLLTRALRMLGKEKEMSCAFTTAKAIAALQKLLTRALRTRIPDNEDAL